MTRQAEALKTAEELLADIELSRLTAEKCLLKATRLARLMSDEAAQEWLRYELHGYDTSSPRWDELMTMTGRWVDNDKAKGYAASLLALQGMLEAERDKMSAMQSTSLAGDYILPAQSARFRQLSQTSENISRLSAIISGVIAALHDFVARTYYELLFSEIQADLFASMQFEIDTRIAPMMGDALSKIDVINERLRTGDTEAISHAMTTCRRLIDNTADAVCPAAEGVAEIDGQEYAIGKNNVLNRLNLYSYKSGATKGRRDRIRRTLSDIYGRVSKGVHEDVTPMEARFVFLQTYLTLGELVTLLHSDVCLPDSEVIIVVVIDRGNRGGSSTPHTECALCGKDFPFRLPPAVIEAAKHGHLIIFAGAGISTERPGLYPQSFYEESKSCLSVTPEDASFPSIMTSYEKEYGRLKLVEDIIDRVNYPKTFRSLHNMTTRFHYELATISQIREVITTNWDDYFETVCGMLPIVNDQDYVYYNLPGRKVYKIHGSVNNVSTIIATLEDYKRREEELKGSLIGGTLRHLLGTKIVVFVGYSLQDDDFKNVYGPLIGGMKNLRPVTYVVSPFDVPSANEFGMYHLRTDGSTFLRSLKAHLVDSGDNLPDSIIERIVALRDLVVKCHGLTEAMDWRGHPELLFSLAYQDGLLDSLGRMILMFHTGEYSHVPHIRHMITDYDDLLKIAVERHRYWDASYIDGYLNAMLGVALNYADWSALPLFELFNPDDFPSEVEPVERTAHDTADPETTDPNMTEDESETSSSEEEEESADEPGEQDWLPELHTEGEIVTVLAGMEDEYPKLFEEARKIIDSSPEPYVFQHTPFLHGVTENYVPPALI